MGWRKGRKIGKGGEWREREVRERGREKGKKGGRKEGDTLFEYPRKRWCHKIWIPAGAHQSMRSLPKSLYKPHGTWLHFQTWKVLKVDPCEDKFGPFIACTAAPPS